MIALQFYRKSLLDNSIDRCSKLDDIETNLGVLMSSRYAR